MSDTNQQGPEYVLGTNPEELARLGFQHRLWSPTAHHLWMRAGIRPGLHVLDIGCGPGFASMDLAQLVGSGGRVVGVDESAPFVAYANEQAAARGQGHARFHAADAAEIESLDGVEPGTFDFAYVRWMFCFVPEPQRVVEAIARLLKPGGRLLVQDYFRYETMCVAPRSEAFEVVIAAIARSWRERGGDPDIMGRLPRMAIDAGMTLEHIERMDPGTATPDRPMWNWPGTFWRVFLPRLEELGYITVEERDAFFATWDRLCQDPAALMHLPPMYEMIAVK